MVFVGDAMEEKGGTITLTTDLALEAPGKMVRIRVRDQGCGIEPANLEKIFEPFFTTKGTKGTGLGLAIVWGIVEGHGGRLTVESEAGQGATFTILLPAIQSSPPSEVETTKPRGTDRSPAG